MIAHSCSNTSPRGEKTLGLAPRNDTIHHRPEKSIIMLADNKDLRAECEILLRRYGVPAVGLARTLPTGVEAIECVGERRHGSGIVVTLNDLWHIGSCAKSMTATLIARLVEQGYLEWEAPIVPVFAKQGAEVAPGFEQISLLHLLSHYSGMAAEESAASLEACYVSNEVWQQRDAFTKQVLAEGPVHSPGEEFCYSNTGYIVAGALAETVTGVAWEDLMAREVFKPLGITTAGFGAPGKGAGGFIASLRGRDVTQPWGHKAGAGSGKDDLIELRPDDDQSDNPPLYGPAGTVHLSLPDLGRYIALHATRGATVPSFLQPESIDLLHTAQFGGEYSLGWSTSPAEESGLGKFAIWHEGSNGSWDPSLLVVPDDGRGLACVSNGCPASLQAGFGMDLVDIYNRWVGAKS